MIVTSSPFGTAGPRLALALLLFASPLVASPDPAQLCEAAAARASAATGVPLTVLRAIALAESGRADGGDTRPWPWAVNYGGDGRWYDTREAADLAATERQSLGASNIDLGCFQLNYHWHGAAFPSISAMLEPDSNAMYAAEFLRGLYAETGSWSDAAAAYHSRTPELAETYRARFDAFLGGGEAPAPRLAATVLRINRFPLLQAGAGATLGSLVPRRDDGVSLIAAAP